MSRSFLLDKSEQNLKAARHLIDINLEAPSIHCSYYACIQVMLHLIYVKLNMTEDKIKEDYRSYKANSKAFSMDNDTGIHTYYFEKIVQLMSSLDNRKDIAPFNSQINQLKRLRVQSDYKPMQVKGFGNGANEYALNIVRVLGKYLA